MNKLVFNPYDIDFTKINRYKANLHTHTTESDGRLYAYDTIQRYKNHNYSILVLTDHDNFRVNLSPREFKSECGKPIYYKNTWPWSVFEGQEKHHAKPGELLRNNIGLVANGMLTVEGVEYSGDDHIGGFDMDYPGEKGYNIESIINEVKFKNGFCVFFHPHYYQHRSPLFYANIFKKYKNVVAMEVYNQGDRFKGGRVLWDQILNLTMPDYPVFAQSNDDMHNPQHLFRNYNQFLMPDLNIAEFRKALDNGCYFFSYEPDGSGKAKAPIIEEIIVDANKIDIKAKNYLEINWIYDQEIINKGKTLNYANNNKIKNYVRAEVINEFGITHTQAFGFIRK